MTWIDVNPEGRVPIDASLRVTTATGRMVWSTDRSLVRCAGDPEVVQTINFQASVGFRSSEKSPEIFPGSPPDTSANEQIQFARVETGFTIILPSKLKQTESICRR